MGRKEQKEGNKSKSAASIAQAGVEFSRANVHSVHICIGNPYGIEQ